MDASYKIQRGIHVHLIQFFMCPEFWVHIKAGPRFARFAQQSERRRPGGGPILSHSPKSGGARVQSVRTRVKNSICPAVFHSVTAGPPSCQKRTVSAQAAAFSPV